MRFCAVLVVAVIAIGAATPAAQVAPTRLTIDEYAARLEALAAAVEKLDDGQPQQGRRLLSDVPAAWTVATGGRDWTIPADWISRGLVNWQRQPGADARAQLVDQLRAARGDALAFAAPVADRASERTALGKILATREFRNAHGPGWFAQMRQRVLRRLLRWLRIIVGSSSLPTITNVVVYALVALAVLALAVWARRLLMRRERDELDLRGARLALETRAKPWSAWLADAQQAARDQDWRQAVRLAYWCGIVYLESRDAWKTDATRTPREYVRLLPAAHEHAAPLRALTGVLERVWYAGAPADAQRYEEALALLRRLGCPA